MDTERTSEPGADSLAMRPETRRLRDYRDVHLIHRETGVPDSFYRCLQHVDRIAIAIGFIGVGKHLADVAKSGSAKYSVGQCVTNGVSIGMPDKSYIRLN